MTLSTTYDIGIAFLVAALLGYALCVRLLNPGLPRHFAWVFGPAVGLGICSFLYVVFRRPMLTVEISLVIVSVVFLYGRFRRGELLPRAWSPPLLGVVLLAALALALPALLDRIDRTPHGSFDGWAIWNTHARLLFRAGSDWKNLTQYTFHGDYPELTPAVAARFWRYAGNETPGAGALAGLILGLSGIAVLVASLSELRDKRLAIVMGLVLLGTPRYLDYAVNQYADVPLSFYFLATLALICLHARSQRKGKSILVLAGFTAGCAAWTKNEGLLFVAVVCLAMLIPIVFRRSAISERFAPFAAGLALPLAVILVFKWTVPVQNDLIENQSYATAIQRLTDTSRYTFIASYFLNTFGTFGTWSITPFIPLFLYIATRGIDRQMIKDQGYRVALATLALVLIGYFLVYVNTPLDLRDHLDSSFFRLAIHLWPSFLLLLGLCATCERTETPAQSNER